jgi:hypothetical protein
MEILELHGPWFLHPDGRWVDAKDLPCKDESKYCRGDGGCLRCDADVGITCRDPRKATNIKAGRP